MCWRSLEGSPACPEGFLDSNTDTNSSSACAAASNPGYNDLYSNISANESTSASTGIAPSDIVSSIQGLSFATNTEGSNFTMQPSSSCMAPRKDASLLDSNTSEMLGVFQEAMDVVYNFPKHAPLLDSPAVTNQCLECAEKDLDIASLRQQVKDLQKELHQINSKLI